MTGEWVSGKGDKEGKKHRRLDGGNTEGRNEGGKENNEWRGGNEVRNKEI